MADEVSVAAPAAAAVAAPSTTSAAVSTPAVAAPAPAAAPAAAAAAPAAPAVAAPVTTTGSEPTIKPGESNANYLARVIEFKNGNKPKEEVIPAAAVEGEAEPEPKTEDEDEPNLEDAEEEKEVEPPVVDEDPDEFDPYEPTPASLSAKQLNAQIEASPEFKALLAASPDLKNSLFANSRLAAEATAFKDVFVNAEEARLASQASAEYAGLSDLVTSIEKPEDASAFYGKLMELSILTDEDGNPRIDPASGKPISDGTVGRLIHHTGALFLNHFGSVAETSNDPELAAAVDILRARAFGGSAPTDNGDLTEEQQAREADIASREAALRASAATAAQAKVREFNQAVTTGIDLKTNAAIADVLSRTDIDPKNQPELAAKILKETYDLMVANPRFMAEQDALMRRPSTEKVKALRIGLANKYVGLLLTGVANKHIAAEGLKIMSRQAKAAAAQTARVEASRSEAQGSIRTSRPVASATTPQDFVAQATTNLKAKLNRPPTFSEQMAEVSRLKVAR